MEGPMKKRISLVIFPHSGAAVRQFHISLRLLAFLATLTATGIGGLGFMVYEYVNMRHRMPSTEDLQASISTQRRQIHQQQTLINVIAKDINTLKNKIIALGKYEDKIRTIANIKDGTQVDPIWGIGGPLPEDTDPTAALKIEHESLIQQLQDQAEQLNDVVDLQGQRFDSLVGDLKQKAERLSRIPSIKPTKGRISSTFGYRESPFTGKREYHSGLDIAGDVGTEVVAAADGTVVFAGEKGPLGELIEIDHGQGLVTRYGHNDQLLKKKGDKVKKGEVIAIMGNSGRSTGPHLHYEIVTHGNSINPIGYFLN
jgi:murein DD-endopeptidase MepM/ murein hydrolase activator NlpD